MKTAISIDDQVFLEAEQTAELLGVSRSKLYSLAVSEYIKIHNPKSITEQLNKVYSKIDSRIDPGIEQLNYDLLANEDW